MTLLLLLLACQRAPEPELVPVVPAPAPAPAEAPPAPDARALALPAPPDLTFTDQDGHPVALRALLAEPQPTAIQFIYTQCGMICPLMGAGFAGLQAQEPGLRLISISIDPANDTPEALRAWGERVGRKPGWTLLTGDPADTEALLHAWNLYSPVISEHAPVALLGQTDRWYQVHGLAAPADLRAVLGRLAGPDNAAARAWFTDTTLTDQDGRRYRFYTDLVAGRSVVINGFYSTCQGSCPAVNGNLSAVATVLGDRLGRDVEFLSISLVPDVDTPEKLRAYAQRFGSPRGWRFLTGSPAEVEAVLRKLGLYTDDIESHSPVVLVGNDRTGLWKKALGFSAPDALAATVRSVIDDPGATP